jgi:NAD-dependent DNA ligase (contains BRCT domain type II)
MTLDPHGQPYNIRFNRARRAERDLSEFLGLAKGLPGDGVISGEEASLVANWVVTHPAAAEQWPINHLVRRLTTIFSDGVVDDNERGELAEILASIVGGTAGVILGEDASTELPFDAPPPELRWEDSIFVFTGKFAFGTRADCQRRVVSRGATCAANITTETDYLVIGTFGSRDWVHTSFGRKIQKAVDYRTSGVPLAIVAEDYWVRCVDGAV